MADVAAFLPRFISERPLPYSECSMCVGVMGAEASDLDHATAHADGTPITKDEAINLVNQLRLSQGITSGGQTIGQVDRAVQQRWPEIPPMARPIGSDSGLRLSPQQFKERMALGWYALVCGNPKNVTDPASPLRTIQGNDDYNHGIGVTNYQPTTGLCNVQNPLGGWSYPNGTSRGFEVVPMKDVLEFAWRTTPDGAIYCGVWEKGAALPAVEPPPTAGTPPISEDQMLTLTKDLTGYAATVKNNTNVRPAPDRGAAPIRTTTAPEAWTVAGFVKGEDVGGSDQWLMRFGPAGQPEYVHSSTMAGAPTPPISPADYTAKVNEMTARLSAKDASFDAIATTAQEGKAA